MSKLARALGVEVTFVDAADKGEGFIRWIGERVGESRKLRQEVMVRSLFLGSARRYLSLSLPP